MVEEGDDSEENVAKKHKIVLLGLLIHFLLLLAVFDVYFASPLEHGMSPIKSTNNPPAKRLILFVADGLRAQAIFGKEHETRTPFLTNIKYNEGSWGIAHTRVPTESRPGHVAMLAGIYEDPSAILKGWKSNPVNFDSVINQSINAWAWGSPDIVKIFNRDNLPKNHIHSYDARIEDFGKEDTGVLDTWVFDRVNIFLKNEVSNCKTNCEHYFEQGNVFFLHLLGIDTAGHGYKPHSKEYINNIILVDENIKEITKLFNSVYKDNSNVFVFTSDHGMTDWGSHGTGLDHETQTPVIAWGAGIRKNDRQQDIKQIDLAPLLASLIGINIPINSLGILPVGYLNVDKYNLVEMIMSNIKELVEIFKQKMLRTEESALIYFPFSNVTKNVLNEKVEKLSELGLKLSIDDFSLLCEDFMKMLIEGVNYYHNYYQYAILLSVSLGFIIWILFLCVSVFDLQKIKSRSYTIRSTIIIIVISILCKISNFPISYYLYFNFPVISYYYLIKGYNIIGMIPKCSKMIWQIIFYVVGIELLVYGFFNRSSYTIIMILVGAWVTISESLKKGSNNSEKIIWVLCCLILSIFPCLPVMKTSFNLYTYFVGYVGYIIIFGKLYFYDLKYYRRLNNVNFQYSILIVQFIFLQLAAVYVILLIEFEYISPDSNYKYVSWVIFVVPVLLIPLTDNFIALRLTSTVFGFAPFYTLVSSNFELLFSAIYVFFLYTWLIIESKTFQTETSHKIIYYLKFEESTNKKGINEDAFRRAFLFMIFIFVGFFGTGTMASLNSFDPMWTRAFLTVFSPFKMMGLILLKFIVPFIFTCSIFRAINEIGKQNVLNIFCIILVFSDLMVLQFLYLITNVGSWLDIGTSLSHFIIMEGFATILLLLYGIAQWLTRVRYKSFESVKVL